MLKRTVLKAALFTLISVGAGFTLSEPIQAATPAAEGKQVVEGKVLAVSVKDRTITVETEQGQQVLDVAGTAKLFFEGRVVPLDKVQPGQKLTKGKVGLLKGKSVLKEATLIADK